MLMPFSIILIAIGLFLMLFFSHVFIIFSSADNPLTLLITDETIIFSIVFIGMGLFVLIIGVVLILKTKPKPRISSAE